MFIEYSAVYDTNVRKKNGESMEEEYAEDDEMNVYLSGTIY